MRIHYDSSVDALYIQLMDGIHQSRTLRLNDDIALNIGSEEQLIGIEVLDAKTTLGSGAIPELFIENIQLTAKS